MTYYPPKARTFHLRNDASNITASYLRMRMLPEEPGVETSLTGASSGSTPTLIKCWVSDALDTTSLPAGVWRFNLYAKVSSATDTTTIKIYVISRAQDGTETALFNVTSAEVNNTTTALISTASSSQAAFTVAATDRLVIQIYANSDSGTAKTITLYFQGATNYSHILLPDDIPVPLGDMAKGVYDPDGDGIIAAGSAGTPATTVTDETTWAITPAVGTSLNYARQDHTHGSPATPAGAELHYLGAYNYQSDGHYDIYLAHSADGRTWTTEASPAFARGAVGQFDAYSVAHACLVKDNTGKLFLYFGGYSAAGGVWSIGWVISTDGGVTWGSKSSMAASVAWQDSNINYPKVIYDREETDANKRFKMWYNGGVYGAGGIGYAYSADGVTWNHSASNPLMTIAGSGWESNYISPSGVFVHDAHYYLFYSSSSTVGGHYSTGYVTFTDPEGTYTRYASNPILAPDGITSTITSNVSISDTHIHVTSATVFPIGAPVWVYDATNHYLTSVTKHNTTTNIEVADAAPVAIASATGNVRSVAYNSVTVEQALYDGGWRFSITGFQPGFDTGNSYETSIGGFSDDLTTIWIDYSAGLEVPMTLAESRGAGISRENLHYIDLWTEADRYRTQFQLPTTTPTYALNDLTDVTTTGQATGDILYKSAGDWIVYPLGVGTKLTVDGYKIRFGSIAGGNYLEIDTQTGNVLLAGNATVWDDLRISGANTRVGSTAPALVAFGPSGNLKTLQFETAHHDEVHFEFQMPHAWKEGTRIYPHVHWTPINTTAGNVVWELEYSWADMSGTFGAPGNMASAATAAGGVAWVHKKTDLIEGGNNYIDGAGKKISSMLVCRLHRNAGAGSDTLAEAVAFLEFDIHYEMDGLGSDTTGVKSTTASLLLETGDYLLLESGDRLLTE